MHDLGGFAGYSNILRRYQVQYDEGLDNILVVDGVPVIDKSKLEKLLQKISKDFSRKGCPIKPENITVPWNDSNGKSKGYVVFGLVDRNIKLIRSVRYIFM